MFTHLVATLAATTIVAAATPALAQSGAEIRGPVVNVPRGQGSEVLACKFGPDGLRVSQFYHRGSPERGPQPGDPCLLFLARAATMDAPPHVGRYPVQVAQLGPTASPDQESSLVWMLVRADRLETLIGCAPDADSGRLRVSAWAGIAGDEDESGTVSSAVPLGEDCLEYLHQRASTSGARLSGPVASTLGTGTTGPSEVSTGLLFLLIPQPSAQGQAKLVRCDSDETAMLRVTYLERGADLAPAEGAGGRPCLETLAEEQGAGSELSLNLVGPLPVPASDDDDGLIFDFADGSIIGRTSTCCACVPVCACGFCS